MSRINPQNRSSSSAFSAWIAQPLVRRHHRDASVQRGVNPTVLIWAHPIAEPGQAFGQLRPKRQPLAHRHGSVDRAKRAGVR
jgi:hypothetical protein